MSARKKKRLDIGCDVRREIKHMLLDYQNAFRNLQAEWGDLRINHPSRIVGIPDTMIDVLDNIADILTCDTENCRNLPRDEDSDWCQGCLDKNPVRDAIERAAPRVGR